MPQPKRKSRKMMPREAFKQFLEYNPETGVVSWKHDLDKKRRKGENAAKAVVNGHPCVYIFERQWPIHRLAFVFEWGSAFDGRKNIIHANGDKFDNRFENLKIAASHHFWSKEWNEPL